MRRTCRTTATDRRQTRAPQATIQSRGYQEFQIAGFSICSGISLEFSGIELKLSEHLPEFR